MTGQFVLRVLGLMHSCRGTRPHNLSLYILDELDISATPTFSTIVRRDQIGRCGLRLTRQAAYARSIAWRRLSRSAMASPMIEWTHGTSHVGIAIGRRDGSNKILALKPSQILGSFPQLGLTRVSYLRAGLRRLSLIFGIIQLPFRLVIHLDCVVFYSISVILCRWTSSICSIALEAHFSWHHEIPRAHRSPTGDCVCSVSSRKDCLMYHKASLAVYLEYISAMCAKSLKWPLTNIV